MAEAGFAVGSPAAVDGVQELLDVGFGLDPPFNLAAREAELVSPVRHAGFQEGPERGKRFRRGPVGSADGEEVRDEFGVPECGSVNDGSSLFFADGKPKASSLSKRRRDKRTHPIVPSQNDGLAAQLSSQLLYIISGALEAIVSHVRCLIDLGSISAAETQGIGADDSETQFYKHGDLVAPTDGEVRPPTGLRFRSQYCLNQACFEHRSMCRDQILSRHVL